MINFKKQKAFSLIELIVYISISSVMVLLLMGSFDLLTRFRDRAQAISEIKKQGLSIMEVINQRIRDAENIDFPPAGESGEYLSLTMSEAVRNPLVVELQNNAITLDEGFYPTFNLSNSRVEASNLIFKNASLGSTQGIINVQFTLSNAYGKTDYEQNFYGGSSLRKL